MKELENITTLESAKAIMGENMIHLKEVWSVFPRPEEEIVGYEIIPYSREFLYNCTEPDEYVLVPGLPSYGKDSKSLTIREMRRIAGTKLPNLFAPAPELETPTNSTMDTLTCLPQWYLLSKKVMDEGTIHKFCEHLEIHIKNSWAIERSVVYVYAWLLFRLLRNEEIFQKDSKMEDGVFKCVEIVSQMNRQQVCLEIIKHQINFVPWRPNAPIKAGDQWSPGIVPSMKHYM